MAYDAFISYSSLDKVIGNAVCATLEQAGIRCWIAPRDVDPGADWGAALVQAIKASRAFVLVFSQAANGSPQILREVERAVHFGIPIVPLRIEDVLPAGGLEYHLGSIHWLDAMSPPMEAHLHRLTGRLRALLSADGTSPEPAEQREAGRSDQGAGRPTRSRLRSLFYSRGTQTVSKRHVALVALLLFAIAGGWATNAFFSPNRPQKILTKDGLSDAVSCLAFSPDGHLLASAGWYEQMIGSASGALEIWDVASGTLKTEFKELPDHLSSLSFSPDGRFLAGGPDSQGNIEIWDLSANRNLRSIPKVHSQESSVAVAFSPDGLYLATGAWDVRFWDVSSGKQLNVITAFRGYINALAFSPGGRTLAAATSKGVQLWDLEASRLESPMPGSAGDMSDVAFSPNGRYVAAAGGDLEVDLLQLWDLLSPREVRTLKGHHQWVKAVAFSPGSDFLASGGIDGVSRVWELEHGTEVGSFSSGEFAGAVEALSFSPDGKFLAVGDGHYVSLWSYAHLR